MSYYTPFKEVVVEPGAKERIENKLKDISKINEERPCSKCSHYCHNKMIRCSLSLGACDFCHSAFNSTTESEQMIGNGKYEDTGSEQDWI